MLMNKEELIGKLQMVYVGDKNALNELIGYYDGLKEVIEIVQQENKKYKEVIDRIDKYIEKETRIYGLSMSIELGTHFDNILGILKGVE